MDRVGRYEITEPLGQGGMGTVYKAYDPLLARVVAVKVISGQFSSQPDLRERFFREARAVARLDHPNIITVYDLGEQDGLPYLAMQFLEGRDLEHRMRSHEGMSLARKVEVALSIAAGLSHAHACGIVHRDVKPANVFITDDGQIKILDFGLARLVTSELTRSNMMVGTVSYMAPEQLRSEKTDHRVDIFSFGVVLYELLGGRKPFQAESFASTMYKILEETPEPLEHLDPELPPRLIAVVDRAIAKAREDRYQLMFDLLRDLEGAYEPIRGSDHHLVTQIESSLRVSTQVKPKSNPPMSVVASDAPTMVVPAPDPTLAATEAGREPLPGRPQESAPTRRPWRAPVLAAAVLGLALLAVFVRSRSSSDVPLRPPVAATPAPRPSPPVPAPAAPVPPPVVPQPSVDPVAPVPAPDNSAEERKIAERLRAAEQDHARRAATAMAAAKASAVSVDAASVVPELFAAAAKQEKAAREATGRGQFASAAARLEAATTLFANAEASARLQLQARATRAREAEAAQRAAEQAPPKVELPRPSPPPVAAAPAPAPPVPPPAPKTEPAPVVDETRTARDAALQVLKRYTTALEHRDIAALKAVWPGLGGREQSAIEAEFENARSISVTFVSPKVDVSGGAVTITGLRQYALQTRDRQDLRTETLTTLALKKVGNDWLIDSVRHQPAGR